MDELTINQLNQLNHRFYQTIGNEFDQTRQQPWQGWQHLTKLWHQQPPAQVIDIGCGNARLASFLHPLGAFFYTGIDSDQQLLTAARKSLQDLQLDFSLRQQDIVSALQKQESDGLTKIVSEEMKPSGIHWITLFGVLHHIPSRSLRSQLLLSLSRVMKDGDSLFISCWQFDRSPNLWQRRVEPSQIEIPTTALETNDYILDWQRGKTGYRYCHLTTTEELQTLADQAQLDIKAEWTADGKLGNLNNYYLLQKKR